MIFEIQGEVVRPTPHSLLIPEFKEIWDSDKTKKKVKAIQAFTYIEFYCSLKKSNPYKDYSDETREEKIKKEILKDTSFDTQSSTIQAAISKYREIFLSSFAMRFYKSKVDLANRAMEEAEALEISSAKDISAIETNIEKAAKMLSALKKLEEQVQEEIYTQERTRNNKELNHFEL